MSLKAMYLAALDKIINSQEGKVDGSRITVSPILTEPGTTPEPTPTPTPKDKLKFKKAQGTSKAASDAVASLKD